MAMFSPCLSHPTAPSKSASRLIPNRASCVAKAPAGSTRHEQSKQSRRYPRAVPDPNQVPHEVSIFVCTDCGAYGAAADDCRTAGHRVEIVNYEISAPQTQPVARTRVEDLKRHGRRLLGGDRED